MKQYLIAAGAMLTIASCNNGTPVHEETTITILQTADIHAYLNPHEELFVEDEEIVFRKAGGLAYIKTLADSLRTMNPDGTVLIDAGDLIQGSGTSVRSKGAIFPEIVQAMHYDLMIPGNWEVVYGKQQMMELMQSYQTPVIVANMFDDASDEPLFPPYQIIEKKGVRIGFIAYNDPEIPERQNPTYSKGIKFTPVEENLQQLIRHLKTTESVDVLFLITHIGISKQWMLANNPAVEGVDFILGSDTHERIRKPLIGKYSKVLEPGAFGSFLGKLELVIRDKKLIRYDYELIEVSPEKLQPDQNVQKIIDTSLLPYKAEMQQILGYTGTPLYRYLVVENPMDNMITDALLWKTGADFATSNGFRFGVPILPDSTGKAAITQADLWRMLPVDEHMKIGKVTGKQIKDWLEKEINNVFATDYNQRFGGWLVRFSGMTVRFNSSAKLGERVESVMIQGKPLDLEKVYRMASCNRTGEPLQTMCRLKGTQDVEIQNYTLHDAVAAYLKAKGVVYPAIDGRAEATDLGSGSFSQIKEVDYLFR